jgi:hypothetical protein
MTVPVSRPRVLGYHDQIDFEVAIEFPAERPSAEYVCTGYPFSQLEMYSRPIAPKMTTCKPYSPFKMDVWQLGISFCDFRVPKIHTFYVTFVC